MENLCGRWHPERRQTGQVLAIAKHPRAAGVDSLHSKNNGKLKQLITDQGLEQQCTQTNNASMRKALWQRVEDTGDLDLGIVEIDLAKEGGKSIWEQVQKTLPVFALFQSDRPSTDQDAEVQEPMATAVKTAMAELDDEIAAIEAKVQERSLDVAKRTVAKLRDFDESLASTLKPNFKAQKNWGSLFKLSLAGEDDVPLNKRGSGVRRLVLFSFFRAEAERRQEEDTKNDIIYAVEEPETSTASGPPANGREGAA